MDTKAEWVNLQNQSYPGINVFAIMKFIISMIAVFLRLQFYHLAFIMLSFPVMLFSILFTHSAYTVYDLSGPWPSFIYCHFSYQPEIWWNDAQ